MTFFLVLLAATILGTTPVEQAFIEGETLDYNLQWLKVTGGTGRMTIAPLSDDPTKLRITSTAKSSPRFSRFFHVHDTIETVVTRDSFSTVQYRKMLNERGKKKDELTTIAGGLATRVKGTKVRKTRVPSPVLDPVSVIYHLRTLDLSAGKAHALTLLADGKLYTVSARVVRRETLETPAGTFKTVMVEPVMMNSGVVRDERLFVWYSDDERRIPVRIRTEVNFGSVTATLSGMHAGVASTEPPAAPAAQ